MQQKTRDTVDRPIKTVYYNRHHVPIKNTRSKDANRAVATCVLHMQINQYGARYAEVFDDESGELHAALKRGYRGNLEIVFSRDPRDFETRYKIKELEE